jgi:hypothetical protein
MPEVVKYVNQPLEYIFREGQQGKNTKGEEVKIIKYNNAYDILVQFQDSYKAIISSSYNNFLKGYLRNPYEIIAGNHGFIGEGIYKRSYNINGINLVYKDFQTWYNMHTRSENYSGLKPEYADVKVCEEWFNFQNFAKWYHDNYYEVEGDIMNLDKDVLQPNSRIYSPDTCCFLPRRLNEIFHNMNKIRSNGLPIGIETAKRKNSNDGYRVKVTYVDENNNRKYVRKTFNLLEDAKSFYSKFKQEDTRRIIKAYKNIIPERIYIALYNYEFKY